jgi:hypothetical protein
MLITTSCTAAATTNATVLTLPLPLLLRCNRCVATIACTEAAAVQLPLTQCWLFHSPPTQQHTDHITKLKTFPFSTSWTYFYLLRVSTVRIAG